MFIIFTALCFSADENCMLCASMLQATQISMFKKRTSPTLADQLHEPEYNEAKATFSDFCHKVSFNNPICTYIETNFDKIPNNFFNRSAVDENTPSSGKICAKLGICKRFRADSPAGALNSARMSKPPSSTKRMTKKNAHCFACQNIASVLKAVEKKTLDKDFCEYLMGPLKNSCNKIQMKTISKLIDELELGAKVWDACERVDLC